ncbi:MAG: VOC family protein [Solirubrobacterales bacterium]|nr:VOC family protein [Solirubrobacterales bacterium]
MTDELVSVRYMVNDVQQSIDFYTQHFGFEPHTGAAPAFTDVIRSHLRLLLACPDSSAGRRKPRAQTRAGQLGPHPLQRRGHQERGRQLRDAGVSFRNEIVTGPGGRQILLEDPAGNPIELFQPAGRSTPT